MVGEHGAVYPAPIVRPDVRASLELEAPDEDLVDPVDRRREPGHRVPGKVEVAAENAPLRARQEGRGALDLRGCDAPVGAFGRVQVREDEPDAPRWPAAISVGTNPTFDGCERRVESYVLDRTDLELYGVPIAVDFYARLRGQVKYAGIEALVEQMHEDVEHARQALRISSLAR